MNEKKLIEKIGNLDKLYGEKFYVALDDVLDLVKQLDEPETGHADEAPRYVKNILARLRELPLHDREVWLKAIMGEFEKDFSHAKWREGYEQGKFEGVFGREKVKIPQFVAGWYEENKDDFEGNLFRCAHKIPSFFDGAKLNEFERWFLNASTKSFQILVNMHQFGYEVEKEKRYVVSLKNGQPLVKSQSGSTLYFSQDITAGNYKVTRKELEDAGFSWVFDCDGVEVEEVE